MYHLCVKIHASEHFFQEAHQPDRWGTSRCWLCAFGLSHWVSELFWAVYNIASVSCYKTNFLWNVQLNHVLTLTSSGADRYKLIHDRELLWRSGNTENPCCERAFWQLCNPDHGLWFSSCHWPCEVWLYSENSPHVHRNTRKVQGKHRPHLQGPDNTESTRFWFSSLKV